ncbi:MAG: hypothetical protein ACWA6U_04790 [Breznakibacter sp.]
MEKDAILNIVINDIKELDLLMSTFMGKPTIPQAYFRLVNSKLNNIAEEMAMLEELHKTAAPLNGKSVETMPPSKEEPVLETKQVPTAPTTIEVEATETLNFIDEEPDTTLALHQPQQEMAQPTAPMNPSAKPLETTNHEVAMAETEPIIEIPAAKAPLEEKEPATALEAIMEASQVVKTKGDHSVLGETIGLDRKSLNETITNQISADDLTKIGTPVNDIRKAMGINDRFYFQRELFDNNNTAFNETLDQINSMSNYNQAYAFLKSKFSWDESQKETEEFLRAVRRRFL